MRRDRYTRVVVVAVVVERRKRSADRSSVAVLFLSTYVHTFHSYKYIRTIISISTIIFPDREKLVTKRASGMKLRPWAAARSVRAHTQRIFESEQLKNNTDNQVKTQKKKTYQDPVRALLALYIFRPPHFYYYCYYCWAIIII